MGTKTTKKKEQSTPCTPAGPTPVLTLDPDLTQIALALLVIARLRAPSSSSTSMLNQKTVEEISY